MNSIVLSHPLCEAGMELLKGKGKIIVTNEGNSDKIRPELRTADAFILRIGKIDREAIAASKNLKVITRPGVGYDSVDVAAATERGIPVVLCPGANTRAVAEHTLALLLCCAKNIWESCSECRGGNFNIRNKYAAVDIIHKTVTVVGFGNIGREFAALCRGIGMEVAVYDPYVPAEQVKKEGYQYFGNLKSALAAGDFVSLHMPLLPSTEGLIGAEEFRAMKPSAVFLNCARGGIVHEPALIEAVEKGYIASAGLDVLAEDPFPADHPLFQYPQVVITPHMAGQSKETVKKLATMAVEGTLAVLRGEQWPYVADPKVYDHPIWRESPGQPPRQANS